jgi:beta-glucosidase
MEVGDLVSGDLEVDAIVHYGHPSERGFSELSALLDGDVNPSGRTVDTWSRDFTADPSYVSVGLHTYDNLPITSGSYTDGGEFMRTFNEYQEGMYMGYRYYETAALVDPSFSYDDAVVFPFGFGLSYTSFAQSIDSLTADDQRVVARVTITNNGSAAGKDVAQLYVTSPYTELDQAEGIEKPACQLVDFAKTGLLQPGQSQTLELAFDREDMASYCYTHENPNGTVGCYVLEAGDYVVSLRENSHAVIAQATVTQDETLWYDGSDLEHTRRSERDAQSALDDRTATRRGGGTARRTSPLATASRRAATTCARSRGSSRVPTGRVPSRSTRQPSP